MVVLGMGILLSSVESQEPDIIELLGTLSEMQTKYEWKKWLMLFCLIAQLIFGGRSRK